MNQDDATTPGPDEPTTAAPEAPTRSAETRSAETRSTGPPAFRTGAEQQWDPEDLAVAEGRDPTPRNIERARRELERDGAAAIERTVP